jgi:hypothetical protein
VGPKFHTFIPLVLYSGECLASYSDRSNHTEGSQYLLCKGLSEPSNESGRGQCFPLPDIKHWRQHIVQHIADRYRGCVLGPPRLSTLDLTIKLLKHSNYYMHHKLNTKESINCVQVVYLYVSYDSHNKAQLCKI